MPKFEVWHQRDLYEKGRMDTYTTSGIVQSSVTLLILFGGLLRVEPCRGRWVGSLHPRKPDFAICRLDEDAQGRCFHQAWPRSNRIKPVSDA